MWNKTKKNDPKKSFKTIPNCEFQFYVSFISDVTTALVYITGFNAWRHVCL